MREGRSRSSGDLLHPHINRTVKCDTGGPYINALPIPEHLHAPVHVFRPLEQHLSGSRSLDKTDLHIRARECQRLLSGMDGEGDGPESVVVSALGVTEAEFTSFTELESFSVELVVEVGVIGYME